MAAASLLRQRAVFAVAAFSTAASAARADAPRPVRLATSAARPFRPTTVLVHGLDSSKQTWETCLATLACEGYPVLAVDLRGHGESALVPDHDRIPHAACAQGPGWIAHVDLAWISHGFRVDRTWALVKLAASL